MFFDFLFGFCFFISYICTPKFTNTTISTPSVDRYYPEVTLSLLARELEADLVFL